MEDLRARLTRIETMLEQERDTVWNAEQVKVFVEAMFNEHQRALEVAERQRELSATALRAEQERAIHDGDERLHDHIAMQIEQIRNALISADKLELERLASLDARVEGEQRRLDALNAAAAERYQAFEGTVADRFRGVNEFRQALDDLGRLMATRRELETATGNVGERLDEHTKQLGDLRSRLDTGPAALVELQRGYDRSAGRQAGLGVSASVLVASLGALATVITIVVVLVNLLTAH